MVTGQISCKVYSNWDSFKYNYFVWCVGFFLLGCQFTHADIGPLKHFTLSWDAMKNWGVFLWTLFVAVILFIVMTVYTLFSHYYSLGIMWYYAAWLVAVVAFFALNTWRWEGQKHLHIHHYTLAMFL